MIKAESSIVINKPIAEVFAYSNNLAKTAEWQSGVVSVKFQDSEVKVGTQYTEVRKFLGRDMETTLEITALKSNQFFSAKTIKGSIPYEVEVTYEPVQNGTKVTTVVQGEPGGFFKLAAGMVASSLEKSLKEDAEHLKAILES